MISEKDSSKKWHDKIKGGLADKKKPSDFDAKQLAAGIEVEMEHTDSIHTATEIAMDHLTEDPDYYKKLKKMEKEDMKNESAWSQLDVLTEAYSPDSIWEQALLEADEFQDYEGDVHPHVQQKRDELKKALKWVADGLRASQYTEMNPLADRLEQIPDMPSERLMPAMQQLSGELHKSKSELRKMEKTAPDQEHKDAIAGALKTIEGALMGLPSMMKAAAAVTTSSKSDKALWQKRPKGYVDDETGEFKRLGTLVHPTGQAPMNAKDKKAKADAEAEKEKQKQISKTIMPKIRKKTESTTPSMSTMFESDGKLGPKFEKLVDEYTSHLEEMFSEVWNGKEDEENVKSLLRDFAKGIESTEGEDESDLMK